MREELKVLNGEKEMSKSEISSEKKEEKLEGAMRIFQALSSVDEELLVRSEEEKKVVPFRKYTKVMAVALCFVVLGAAAFVGNGLLSTKDSASSDAAPMEMMYARDEVAEEVTEEKTVAQEPAADVSEMEQNAWSEEGPTAEDLQGAMDNASAGEKDVLQDYALGTVTIESTEVQEGVVRLDEGSLRATETLGQYVPAQIPAGYVFVDGSRYDGAEGPEIISLTWAKGMDDISVTVAEYVEGDELSKRLVDVSKPETYDVHLYEIPYADSVPDEVRESFLYPIFKESDFTLEVVEARMKSVADAGDTDTPRGSFAVLYDSGVLVSFRVQGETEAIWEMLQP